MRKRWGEMKREFAKGRPQCNFSQVLMEITG